MDGVPITADGLQLTLRVGDYEFPDATGYDANWL